MEIPYVITPRKDTGLFNSKIAIWLFLASEVMLFGGLFSGYVFLRLGADYPWPERTLPVLPGLINTFVLIGSSVTVVFAWAALKMRNWNRFVLFMGVTIACALLFMVLKAVEYNVKFHHQGVRLSDYTVIEGHLGKEMEDGNPVLNAKGKEIEENVIRFKAGNVTFNSVRFHHPWVEEIILQAEHHKSKITLTEDISAITKEGVQPEVIAKAGEELSVALLEKVHSAHGKARSHNGAMRTAALRKEWSETRSENPGKRGWELASDVNIDTAALEPRLLTELATVSFKIEPATEFHFAPRDVKEAESQARLRDDTQFSGKLHESPMVFHDVDAVDFRHLAMKAVERGQDPIAAVENSWLLKNHKWAREAWEWNKDQAEKKQQELIRKHGINQETGLPNKEPTAKERYRIGWKDFVAMTDGVDRGKENIKVSEEFKGPDYEGRREAHTFPHVEVPREQVAFASKFTPSWNTYYAIYFTVTGLHGLHVIGGALVLSYYLFFGRKMFESNPEWLTNRVEIGGLFWHFVDLVWIFAFPIFYLM